jgi:thiamine-monophosphate kinase
MIKCSNDETKTPPLAFVSSFEFGHLNIHSNFEFRHSNFRLFCLHPSALPQMSTESDFLDWIKKQQQATPLVPLPSGDDLAVLNWPSDELLLIGVDQVLDFVHFDTSIHTPRAIGRKAVNRNLSDCAAMGCLPAALVASFALPAGVGLEYAKELYLGMRDAADPFDCVIVGGDTGTWKSKLAVSVTIIGRADGIRPITRVGAKAGDGIYVTGPLGGSILGRHMTFSPRIREGRELASSGVVTAMIDLSDGLSRDLPRLCSGAIVEEAALPIHDDARIPRANAGSPFWHALHDGEDYELLFTSPVPPPLGVRVGTVTGEEGIFLRLRGGALEPIVPLGWEHRL